MKKAHVLTADEEMELMNGAPTLAFADRVTRMSFKETESPAVAAIALVRVLCGLTLSTQIGTVAERRAQLLELVGKMYDQLGKERAARRGST